MRLILTELRSRLQYKIIVPFLLLTLCVALAGSALAFRLVAGSWQERFSNQLAQVARDTNDSLVDQERANLLFLQEVAFAQANPSANAPAVAEALAAGDDVGLARALDPYFRNGLQRPSVRLDRLIAFDRAGKTRFDWERTPGATDDELITRQPLDLARTWLVPRVLGADQDVRGDKFAGLILLPDTQTYYLGTIAPVRNGTQIVGGLIVAMRIDSLIETLRQHSQAAIVGVYQGDGKTLASTLAPAAGLNTLDMSRQALQSLQSGDTGNAVFGVPVNARDYQFAYSSLRVRDDTIGIIAVALSRDYVLNAWADARQPLAVLTLSLMLAIVALGIYIARLITAPLQELVVTARAVTAGNLERRSNVRSNDEVGLLSQSFNTMTEHLLQLYEAVRDEASERAAIVESIVDGVVVCDTDGRIRYANRAMRQFLQVTDDEPLPTFFHQLPLAALSENATFDQRVSNLFTLNQWVVRVSAAPVIAHDGTRLGSVGVLQDMTAEVAVDRAKTNFIATISHELRTPLTVLRGNADLLLRGLMGQLEPEQRGLVETMRSHTINMASLVNNVIVIAGIDSGSLISDPETLDLRQVLEEVIWPLRAQITAKGLDLKLDLPADLPSVHADMFQLRTVLTQLIDNARRYTVAGHIGVRATALEGMVCVDVSDTGPGIPETLHEHLFLRFVRGNGSNEGINSAERGIGLGLAIVKQLVERQGGRVWVAQTSEAGTTLSFTVPSTNATEHHIDPPSDEPHAAAA